MKNIIVVLIVLIAMNAIALSLPRFSLMTGAKCGACHVNPTGAQMRTEYGSSFSVDALPLAAHKEDDFLFNPKLTDNITIGGDYRGQLLYNLAEDPADGEKGKTAFHAMTATIYGSVLLSKKVSFYFKQDILNPNYGSFSGPEIFGIAKLFPKGGYVKAGAFMPDYGWRIDDHTNFTRGGDVGVIPGGFVNNGLFFTPNYKDIGIEAGFYVDDFIITTSLLNGTGNSSKIAFSKDKAYTAKIEYMGKADELNYRLGVTGYGYKQFKMGGLLAGISYGDWVLYGEMDWTHHKLNNPFQPVVEGVNMSAAYLELDYRAIQGLWFTGKFDMVDPINGRGDDDLTPVLNSVKRLTFGLEFFPYTFVELRPQYRLVMEKPSADNDQALIQLHLWF